MITVKVCRVGRSEKHEETYRTDRVTGFMRAQNRHGKSLVIGEHPYAVEIPLDELRYFRIEDK